MTEKFYCVLNDTKLDNFDFNNKDTLFPLFETSDKSIEEIYYYRFETFLKHVKATPDGFVITEFLPNVPWAGIYNTISCAAGHHFREGRWLHNNNYLDDYAKFWFSKGNPMLYSFWVADSVLQYVKVTGNKDLAIDLYQDLKNNYNALVAKHGKENGLFVQLDGYDGMERSIGGSGFRPTINSYLYGELLALSEIAKLSDLQEESKVWEQKANELKSLINENLWVQDADFYETMNEDGEIVNVREEIGFVPWYFNLPDNEKCVAWKFLMDKDYFLAPFGITTAEQNHKDFMKKFEHECLWNGPVWPYATSQTLTALSNLFENYSQNYITKSDYIELLRIYAKSQHLTENGVCVPFIDENLHPYTGEWLARKILIEKVPPRDDAHRGLHYNHSTYCDLVINGLCGIRPTLDNSLSISPIIDDTIDYFCLDGVKYPGKYICVCYDKTGEKYGLGKGLFVFVNGEKVAHNENADSIILKI